MASNPSEANTSIEYSIGPVSEFLDGVPRMIKAGAHRLLVAKTESGIAAIDNACPHQGYGLVQGGYANGVVTCQWHNWKFDISSGVCLNGEENVACHVTRVVNDEVIVTIRTPDNDETRANLWPSLDTAMSEHRIGQISRDTARLLAADTQPSDIVGAAMAYAGRRNEYGFDHGMATATDCLSMTQGVRQRIFGDERTLALAQGLDGLCDDARYRQSRPMPEPFADLPQGYGSQLMQAIDSENIELAEQLVVTAIHYGVGIAGLKPWFIRACGQHHYDFGHQAIYVQKAFELLEIAGPELALDVLPTLAFGMAYGTKEDVLPYMKKFMRDLANVDLAALAHAPSSIRTPQRTNVARRMAELVVDEQLCPTQAIVEIATANGGVEVLLDAVVLAGSLRLARYDDMYDRNGDHDFRWLDITHVVTYAHATRWAWHNDPGVDAARLALFTLFLAHDSGRGERRGMAPITFPTPVDGGLRDAILRRDARTAVAAALGSSPQQTIDELLDMSLEDGAGSFIVQAHIIKLSVAAAREFELLDDRIVLAGAAAFSAGRRIERFVANAAHEAIDFIRIGQPPKRYFTGTWVFLVTPIIHVMSS